jgi:IS30 family transposase
MVSMKNYRHITIGERELIFRYLGQGKGFREMGRLLGRSDRTIAREIRGNGGISNYSPSEAQKRYTLTRAKSKSKKLDDVFLKDFVVGRLNRGWSPEQIAGRITLLNPDLLISHETIYKFVYSKSFKDFRYWEFLRRGHVRRQKKHDRKSLRYPQLRIPHRISISERPAEAVERSKTGHWETDLMEGVRKDTGAVTVTVDRKSGYVLLDMLKVKEAFLKAYSLIKSLKYLPAKTVTFDNGTENFKHEVVTSLRGCKTFFCAPYHAWEKGTVENTIGLVRSYVPKKTSLSAITNTDLSTIARELNNRPRKRLGYLTPYEVMFKDLTAAVHP